MNLCNLMKRVVIDASLETINMALVDHAEQARTRTTRAPSRHSSVGRGRLFEVHGVHDAVRSAPIHSALCATPHRAVERRFPMSSLRSGVVERLQSGRAILYLISIA